MMQRFFLESKHSTMLKSSSVFRTTSPMFMSSGVIPNRIPPPLAPDRFDISELSEAVNDFHEVVFRDGISICDFFYVGKFVGMSGSQKN